MYPKQLTFFPKYNTVFTFFLCYTSVLQISSSYFQSPWMHTRNGCMAFSVWPSCWWRVAHAYVMLGKLSTSSLCWMPKWQGYNTEAQLEDRDMMSPCNRKCLKNGLQAGITRYSFNKSCFKNIQLEFCNYITLLKIIWRLSDWVYVHLVRDNVRRLSFPTSTHTWNVSPRWADPTKPTRKELLQVGDCFLSRGGLSSAPVFRMCSSENRNDQIF